MTEILRVDVGVTQEDIDHGLRRDCRDCPIALAVKRAIPECIWVSIGICDGTAQVSDKTFWSFDLPKCAATFIRAFDRKETVNPLAFLVSLQKVEWKQ